MASIPVMYVTKENEKKCSIHTGMRLTRKAQNLHEANYNILSKNMNIK